MKRKRRLPFSLFTFACLLGLSALVGCGQLMHPRAGEFLKQAQQGSGAGEGKAHGIPTLINLTGMMEASLQAARRETASPSALNDLHDQFHALHQVFCQVTEVQAASPFYVKAVTLNKELRTVFHRLWKYRTDAMLRDLHLDLFALRLRELRETLQAVSG
jgi:hypothetical protein